MKRFIFVLLAALTLAAICTQPAYAYDTRLAKGLLTDSHDMAEKMGFEPMRPLRTLTI